MNFINYKLRRVGGFREIVGLKLLSARVHSCMGVRVGVGLFFFKETRFCTRETSCKLIKLA